jgi:dolichol kinase
MIPSFENLPFIEISRLLILFGLSITTSYLVKKGSLKVNYSRKILHFGHLLSIFAINKTFFNYSIEYFMIAGTLSFAESLIMVEPLRKRSRFISFIFLSYDRPEDRPHTVRLVATQIIGMNIALIGVAYLYQFSALPLDLLAIPLIITAFGDGLAEPVGVFFGKHLYKVKDMFGKRIYTRSYEGSSMVFFSSILALIAFNNLFLIEQLICLLIFVPLLMTITEAYSPHTWDNPFLYLVGGLAVYFIVLAL